VFAHLGLSHVEGFLPRSLQAPYGVFLYGTEAWKPLPPRTRRRLRAAKVRVAVSEFTARRAVEVNDDIGDIAVVPLALPRRKEVPERQPAPSPDAPDAPIVLIVGRMAVGEGYKGHDQLIDAWPHVAASVPGAELLIVGDGDDRPRLEAKARRLTGGQTIEFAGFVDRPTLERTYERAAVFAMPSRGEGFGLVYLEAMAHGLPCVGSVHDAAGEVIVHGGTGMLVNLDDPEALGRSVVCLLRDAGLRRRMGEAGRQRLRTHFSFDRFSRNLLGVLGSHLEVACP
jgi:phosphatidylinositol alpha-1,6-mannosyltransferase